MEIARYTFHVNSSQRSSGTITDMNLNLTQILSLKAVNSSFQIIMHGASIPFSFYQLGSDINTITCTFRDTSAVSKTAIVTLTPGNYSTVSILAQLAAQLTTICQTSVVGGFTGFTPVFDFKYSTITCKTTLAMTAPSLNAFITIPFNTNLNLGAFFGMTTSQTISTVSTPVSSKISVANPVSYLVVRCGNLKQQTNREFMVEKNVFSDVIYRIPITTQANTYISSQHDSDPIYFVNNNITNINFYLTTNLTYIPIDLQGLDWSFYFSIVEMLTPIYKTIESQLLTSLIPDAPNFDEERAKLQAQLKAETDKLSVYKDKLTRRNRLEVVA